MRKGLNQCPVEFSVNKEYANKDIRFIDVTIDIMHTGDNLNMTSFDRRVIDKAIPSLKNIPILGYIVNPREEDSDFKGHEHELVVTDDEIKYVYSGRAYGVIPENCNPRWVTKDDGTGVQREYLRADGILWTKFDDCSEIFTRDGEKNHSVELTNMSGKVDQRGYYVVDKFDFDGCCILSTTDPKIRPAMTGSNITANFSVTTIAGEIKAMLNEYQVAKDYCVSEEGRHKFTVKGESVMDEKLNILKEFGLDATSFEFSLDDISVDELKAKCEELIAAIDAAAKDTGAENAEGEIPAVEAVDETNADEIVDGQNEEHECEQDPDANEVEDTEVEAEATIEAETEQVSEAEYALDTLQMLDEVNRALCAEKFVDSWGDECVRYWLEELTDAEVIVFDCADGKTYGIPYSMNGDNVSVDFEKKRRKKCSYVDWEDGGIDNDDPSEEFYMINLINKHVEEFAELKAKYEDIAPKYDAFVEAQEAAERAIISAKFDNLFAIMDEKLGDCEEYVRLKDNRDIGYDAMEKECYALVGKRMEFSYVPSTKTEGSSVRFGVFGVQTDTEGKYGDLFERYLSKK